MLAYFDCFSGVSGNMVLGALVHAGLSLETLKEQLARVDLGGYRLEVSQRQDHGIHGLEVNVHIDEARQQERTLADIRRLLETSRLEPVVAATGIAVFERLARAEARVHGTRPDDVHFHEVGAVDSIVDVVGAVTGLATLKVDQVYASSMPLGSGTVKSRHGTIPLPAPGTLEILAEVGAPTRPVNSDRELVTPTGAALLAEMARFEQPSMRLARVGYGFGRHRLPWPNCLRLWLGNPPNPQFLREEMALLETNLDDTTGEELGYAMERLFAAGALDVFFQSLQMKKNRPGILLGVLARPSQAAELAGVMLAETSSLGVRVSRLERFITDRWVAQVETELGPLQVKVKRVGEREVATPEYEDAARLARERGIPLSEVYRAVMRAAPIARPD